ncbi:MAG: ImcF-related family protein, partial [Pseudomonadota bacterium]
VLPELNQLRDLPTGYANSLDQIGRQSLIDIAALNAVSVEAYRTALSRQFLPRVLLRLEDLMRANTRDTDVLYDALKAYLMLGQKGPLEREFVQTLMTADWALQYPGAALAPLRADLDAHLFAMLEQPMDEIALDAALIERTRRILADVPTSVRVYRSIINSQIAREVPAFRLTEIGGPSITRVFQRASGDRWDDGIPGIFTHNGFHQVFLTEALSVAIRVQAESYVLGQDFEQDQSETALVQLSRDVLSLYYSDFIEQYETLLGDIDIIPTDSLAAAVEITGILSGATSPIQNILNAVASETKLTEDRLTVASLVTDGEVIGLSSARSRLFMEAIGVLRSDVSEFMQPGQVVEDHFAQLHQLIESAEGQPSELDALMSDFKEVNAELRRVMASPNGAPEAGLPALASFQQAAAAYDRTPLSRWAQQIQGDAASTSNLDTRARLNAIWQAEVLPVCDVTNFAYPFERNAMSDIPFEDFDRLFAPGGLIDGFFQENLAPFVDTSMPTWGLKSGTSADFAISDTV